MKKRKKRKKRKRKKTFVVSGLVSSVLAKRFTGKNVSEVTCFMSSGTLNLYSNLKPNSITLADSKLVGDQLRTSQRNGIWLL